jgi:hypothetical protein
MAVHLADWSVAY